MSEFHSFAACISVPTSNKCSLVFTPSQVYLSFPLWPLREYCWSAHEFRGMLQMKNMYLLDQHDSLLAHLSHSAVLLGINEKYYTKHVRGRWIIYCLSSYFVHLPCSIISLCYSDRPTWLDAIWSGHPSLSHCVRHSGVVIMQEFCSAAIKCFCKWVKTC